MLTRIIFYKNHPTTVIFYLHRQRGGRNGSVGVQQRHVEVRQLCVEEVSLCVLFFTLTLIYAVKVKVVRLGHNELVQI